MRQGATPAAAICGLFCLTMLATGPALAQAPRLWPPRLKAPPSSAPASRLTITGSQAQPETLAREAAGQPPQGADLKKWLEAATARIVEAYQARGYPYARAWYRINKDGTTRIHLDEGRARVVFTGTGSIGAFFMRVGLNLPHGVIHVPTLERVLEDLKRAHELNNVYYRVKEPGDLEVTSLGDAVPQRALQIYVVSRELVGWAFDIGLSSTWGVLPGVIYERGNIFWTDDRLRLEAQLAFPFRQYLFEEDPSFQWVHGGFKVAYRPPRFWRRRLAPRLENAFFVSHFDRQDLQLRSYYRIRNTTLTNLVLFLPALEVALGGGVDAIRVFQVELMPDVDPAPLLLEDQLSVRGLGRLRIHLEASSQVMRRNQRSFAEVRFDVASSRSQPWLIDVELWAQGFLSRGRHRFLIRPHALLLAGHVRFWDETQLGGDWQRVFFDNRYWVQEAVQLELGYRINVWSDWIDVGIFHDLSVFSDRTRESHPATVVNAFGPSLHLMLFDIFALDVFVGFGFAPIGFGHTLSFSLDTVF